MEFSAGWQLLQAVVQNVASHVAQNLGRFTDAASDSTHCRQKIRARLPLAAVAAQPQLARRQAPGKVTKADVGRATWLLLHTIAAQFPENPTRQQRRDVSNLVDILTRLYPCAECAKHFKEVVRDNPPKVASRRELQRWTCTVHNVVNRSIGKPTFNCDLAEQRWGSVECDEDNACSLDGRR